jgi:hypothetical protein
MSAVVPSESGILAIAYRVRIMPAQNRDVTTVTIIRDSPDGGASQRATLIDDGLIGWVQYGPYDVINPTFMVPGPDSPRAVLKALRDAINRYLAETDFP